MCEFFRATTSLHLVIRYCANYFSLKHTPTHTVSMANLILSSLRDLYGHHHIIIQAFPKLSFHPLQLNDCSQFFGSFDISLPALPPFSFSQFNHPTMMWCGSISISISIGAGDRVNDTNKNNQFGIGIKINDSRFPVRNYS